MLCKDVANVVRACFAEHIHQCLRAIDTFSGETVLVLSVRQLWWFFAMADQVNDRFLVVVVTVLAIVSLVSQKRFGKGLQTILDQ